jgi:hypothetical protein
VSALVDMETSRAADEARDSLYLRHLVDREATHRDAISSTSFALALEEHVRCQGEYEVWQRIPHLSDCYEETDRALRARSLQSTGAARLAARACGRCLRAEDVEPSRMVKLVRQVLDRVLDETTLEYPDMLRMRILTWAVEGYNAGD